MRIYFTRLKCLLRDKGNLFWAIIFPICLGTFFYLGFGRLTMDSMIDTVDAYVASDYTLDILVKEMQEVKINNDKPLFNVDVSKSKDELEQLLLDNKIKGYIYIENDEIVYRVNSSGLEQTITKSFLDQYLQITTLIIKVNTTNPDKLLDVLTDLGNQQSYVREILAGSNPKANRLNIYFYALIAMACLYGSFWGVGLVRDIEADNSPLAARVNITPTHKFKLIIMYFLAALTLHFFGNVVLVLYLKYLLQVEFSNNLALIILTSFVGTIGGITFGSFIAVLVTGSPEKKEGIVNVISLFLSFLSGLMVLEVKYFIDHNIPILGYINPASLLTDSLYSLYYYNSISRYFTRLTILAVLSIVFIIGTYIKMRGNRYDSV